MLCECKVGQAVEVTVTFTDANNALADPSTATIKIRHALTPNTVDAYTGGQLTRVSLGVYSVVFTPDKPGKWYAKGIGTGSVTAIEEDFVLATQTAIA